MKHLAPWLEEAPLQRLFALTRNAGGEARVVGGAVRDAWLGRLTDDLDLASTLKPEQTMELAHAEGWKAVPTGIAHGTVTLVLPNRVVEVTTLRRDVHTDGRHATVAFTDRFEEDAARRDFTINALYLDAAGNIYDYFGGRDDLQSGKVRFIGDAEQRIREDGLRILRFFRFVAWYGKGSPDREAIHACERQQDMLARLSGERIAREMKKLLVAPSPYGALGVMARTGVAPLVSGGDWQTGGADPLAFCAVRDEFLPWVRLLALVPSPRRETMAEWVSERWKLSRLEQKTLGYLSEPIEGVTPARVKEWVRQQPSPLVEARLALLAASDAAFDLTTVPRPREVVVPEFPVRARDLLARGMPAGPAISQTLRELERYWQESDYRTSRDALLAMLDRGGQE